MHSSGSRWVVGFLCGAGLACMMSARAQNTEVDSTEYASVGADVKNELTPLPAEARKAQAIQLDGRTLNYTAAVGALPVRNESGKTIAEVVYTAYTAGPANAVRRPVTFVFNGGPGVASALLNEGGVGPKWIKSGVTGASPSEPAILQDNPGTWLGFTDLVFIDPVGTGFSRSFLDEKESLKHFYSNEPDFQYLSRVVYDWLVRNKRLTSPKYLAGESFSGYRVPRMARLLQTRLGVGVSGLILISPALDRAQELYAPISPLPWIITLPTMAAAHLETLGQLDASHLQPAIDYARGEYLLDLVKGRSDPQALERMITNVTRLTGLSEEFVRNSGARIDPSAFVREVHRKEGKLGSYIDSNVTIYDPFPYTPEQHTGDPIADAHVAAIVSALVDFYTNTLGWPVDERFYNTNHVANSTWNGNEDYQAESVTDLRRSMATDPALRVLVAHGFNDLSCPFMASLLLVDQMPVMGDPHQIEVKIYPGGHMFYNRMPSRMSFQHDVQALYQGK